MRILLVALLALCAVTTARAQAPVEFSGTWWSERCSKLDVRVGAGGLLSGNFASPGVASPYPLTGFRAGADLIAFSVNFGPTNSLASWAGQHTLIAGAEVIMTMWLITKDVPDDQELVGLWASNLTGYDNFRRAKPSYCG
jgi:hypothetical protein